MGIPSAFQGKRAVIYARVSLDATGEGRSVERQLEACRQLCELRGWTVVEERVDNSISASTGKVRPAWQSVLAMVGAREVDLIVAWHIDRMTRSMLDLEELILLAEDADIGIATASGDLDLTTDVGRMVARILAAVARAEVERKGARQKLANAARAAEGNVHSGGVRPFGYENDRITVVPEEAEAIRQAAVDVLAGKALAEVAREWAAAGLVSSRAEVGWEKGNRKPKAGWTPRGVKNVLVNPRYAGIRVYNGDEVGTGVWDKILGLETYLSLVQMLVDPNRKSGENAGRSGRKPQSLVTGIARCQTCRETVRAASSRGELTYSCPMSHVHTNREYVDTRIHGDMIDRLSRPDALALLTPSGDDKADEVKAEVERQQAKLDQLAKLLAADLMTVEQFTIATAAAREKLKRAEGALGQIGVRTLIVGLDLGTPKIKEQWMPLPLERQRKLVQALLEVTLVPRGRKRRHPMPLGDQVIIDDSQAEPRS
ncbi:recombinase family protein [Streptomyces sp. H27-D2]|uniref:recombinase family protein n=1 Tax=Streptomyces sp. H27-D2 TaxID=3046304 RepID=UPI002DBDD0EE|nr:recombinase family protein [Streptomyces sp. H27-D2]MEC4018259.1 recombinase family protein [Streptomyces sp. H27-D2]